MNAETDELAAHLADGWEIKGYSVCLMAAGATSHHVLLQKGAHVATFGIVNPGPKEITRGLNVISPKPEAAPKRGFFG